MAAIILTDTEGGMMDNTEVVIAALGIVVTSVGALIWIVKFLMVQLKSSIDKSTKSQEAVAKALEKLSKNTDKNTAATTSADTYLRQRNGRDNEHNSAVLKGLNEIPNTLKQIADDQAIAIIKAVKVEQQYVHDQTVEHQTIRKKA